MKPSFRPNETLPTSTASAHSALFDCGIYCLGSDSILDWMIGLLESLKVHAPHLRLYVIPFDDNISRLTALQSRYGFEFYHSDTHPLLESMARTRLGKNERAARVFRKFSVFWGPLTHFLFLDADIIVQDDLDGLFEAYKRSPLQFAFADIDMDQVYKPGALREAMQASHGAQGFNSGCFLSSRGALTLPQVQQAAQRAAGLTHEFVSQYEQSFFNYLVDTSGTRQGSISGIYAAYGPSIWAALTPLCGFQSNCRRVSASGAHHPMPMLHWAGYPCESAMPNARYFLRYRLRYGTLWERLVFLDRFSGRQRAAWRASLSPRPALGRLVRSFQAIAGSQRHAPRDSVQP